MKIEKLKNLEETFNGLSIYHSVMTKGDVASLEYAIASTLLNDRFLQPATRNRLEEIQKVLRDVL